MNFVFNAGSWQKEMINEKEIRKLYFSPQKKKITKKKTPTKTIGYFLQNGTSFTGC